MFNFANTGGTNWGMWGVIVPSIIFGFTVLATAIGVFFRLKAVEKSIDADIKPELKSLGGRIDKVLTNVLALKLDQSGAVEGQSPRALTPKGERILNDSGIKELVDAKLGDIISEVKKKKPDNEYRIEQGVIESVRNLSNDATLKDTIEEGAFNSGTTVDVVLFVGAIYIRDQVIAALKQD